jgi:hypothetical protein
MTNRHRPDSENEIFIQKIIGNERFKLEDFEGTGILKV